jgi:hypothetical protein
MITLRCTRKAADALGAWPLPEPPSGTGPLGEWYVNLIPTVSGGFFLFMNARCLLSVVVPRQGTAADILNMFVRRVANILSLIGLHHAIIDQELEHFRDIRIGKTASRRLLGVMNEVGFHLQSALEESTKDSKLSLSDFEFQMAEMPQATMDWNCAAHIAIKVLQR